jgi:tRNA (guanine10-N2)-dimethyltransferase
MQSFFVVSGENVELARDEIVAISKSYDKDTSHETDSKLVITNSSVLWDKIAARATFVKIAGKIVDTFSDLFSEIDLTLLHKSDTFACRTINLSSKRIDLSSIEKTVGATIKQASGARVSLSNPALTVYLIFTDNQNYLGYSTKVLAQKRPKKIIKSPFELNSNLSRAIVNLSGLNEDEVLCDPFCGTGTILLEAESMGIRSIGIDFDKKMCEVSKKNLGANGYHSQIINAGYQHIKKINYDGIVTDMPYGISSKSSESPKKLVSDFISILPKKKKLALMCKKELADQIELKQAKRYEIYRHKSLTRTILVK